MAIQLINKGSAANDRTGTNARDAADIINDNFSFLNSLISGLQTALNGKENSANKTDDIAGNVASSVKFGSVKGVVDWVNSVLANYVQTSSYQQHFKGVYPTLSALQAANPTGVAGDYAQVDTGGGNNVITYAYDVQDGWIILNYTGSGALNTDQLPEGQTNFYFTAQRAISALASTLTNFAQLAVAQSFTKAQRVTPVTLTSSAGAIAIDFALSNNFSHTLTENTTLANPTNCVAGQSGQITITQNAGAAKTLSFGTNWHSSDGTAQVVSTTLNAVNLIAYYVNSPTNISFYLHKHGII